MLEDILKSLVPELKKNETKHGVEYSLKFKNGSTYDFSFSKAAPLSDQIQSMMDVFIKK